MREMSNRPVSPPVFGGNAMRRTMKAENRNVTPSSSSARLCGRPPSHGTRAASPVENAASTAKMPPARGSVPYVLTSPIALAFASCRLGTMFGSDASRAGVHSSERHSITNESRKIAHSSPRKAMAAYITARPRSARIMICLRSVRSTRAPANGPNNTAGSMRAVITAPTARPAAAVVPDSLVTSEVTAMNPTQSPSDETVIAASSRENAGCVSRSLRVAARVPRSAATSSATDATMG